MVAGPASSEGREASGAVSPTRSIRAGQQPSASGDACFREELLNQRRALMQDWTDFVTVTTQPRALRHFL